MLEQVQSFIRSQHLLDQSQRCLVAVSGGADSVALLRALCLLGYAVEACHCNFQLRGAESDRDEAFVKALCEQLSVPFHLIHFDTRTYADLHQVSIEMAARELRYRYFEQLAHDLDISTVCVAHHRDDLVETLLLNMLRGTGIHGMTGIRPCRPISDGSTIRVVRPLLCIARADIEKWLNKKQQSFVTDSTNLVDDVQRNQLRLNILPLLQKVNPAAYENLQTTASLMAEAERIYDAEILQEKDKYIKDNKLVIKDLQSLPSPICLLHEWLSDYGFSSATIRQIADHLDAPTGRQWHSATHDICIDRGQLLLSEQQAEMEPFRIPETGLYRIHEQLQMRLTLTTDIHVDRSPQVACLDAEKVKFPLTIRPVHEGDRFIPFGMKGSKLISDFLTDLKLPLPEKRRQLVMTDAASKILWVVGRRVAQPFAITSSTAQMLCIQSIC